MSQPVNIQDIYKYVDLSQFQQMRESNSQKITEATQAFLEKKNQIRDQNLPSWRWPVMLVSAGTCGSISAVSSYFLEDLLSKKIVSLITDTDIEGRLLCEELFPFYYKFACAWGEIAVASCCAVGGIAVASYLVSSIKAIIKQKAMDKAAIATYEDFQQLYQMKKEAYKSELKELSRLIKDLKEVISKTPPGEEQEFLRTEKSQLKETRIELVRIKSAELNEDARQLEVLEKRILEEHPERELMRNSAHLPMTFQMV